MITPHEWSQPGPVSMPLRPTPTRDPRLERSGLWASRPLSRCRFLHGTSLTVKLPARNLRCPPLELSQVRFLLSRSHPSPGVSRRGGDTTVGARPRGIGALTLQKTNYVDCAPRGTLHTMSTFLRKRHPTTTGTVIGPSSCTSLAKIAVVTPLTSRSEETATHRCYEDGSRYR